MQVADTLPRALRHLSGEIMDIDSHEQMPAQLWVREMGPELADLAEVWLNNGVDSRTDCMHPNVVGYVEDDVPITPETIRSTRGGLAPGAADPSRRPAVMDLMGIKRQLMFPTAGMHPVFLAHLHDDYGYSGGLKRDRKQYGHELLRVYNRWGMRAAKHSDRVRPVLPLFADTVDELMEMARELIDNSIRAIWLPSGMAPGGRSPAHSALDPFWTMMAENNIAVCLHIGLDSKIFGTDVWNDAESFHGFKSLGEIRLDPWSMSNQHTTSQNFVLTMVLGGVFERHPMLRFGVIELGAHWIGPLCDNMDLWYTVDPGKSKSGIATVGDKKGTRLTHAPSWYVKRNIRVTGFEFEPFDRYLRNHDLEDVLCFASDYPHIEGGKDPIGKIYPMIEPFGQEVVEKFFVTNGQWLLPD